MRVRTEALFVEDARVDRRNEAEEGTLAWPVSSSRTMDHRGQGFPLRWLDGFPGNKPFQTQKGKMFISHVCYKNLL